jgi:MYXO-CTERM domain-containing protein
MVASNRNGLFEVVARVGNAVPGYDGSPHATDLYRNFGTSGIGFNDAGKIAFSSSLRNAPGTQTATGALFTDVGGSLKMVARASDPLPTIYSATGIPLSEFSGVTWGTSYNSLAINASNTLVFQAAALGNTGATNNTGAVLSMDSSGRFTKIQRNGDVAIVGGSPLGGDAFFLNTSNIAVNPSGQIAMSVTLTGPGVSVGLGNGSALFGWDPVLGMQLIARTGDLFQVATGDERLVTSIGGIASSGGQDGRVRSLNDAGLLAFELDFADGSSGIFTATIPSPASLAPLALAALVARRRRRR